ncbi:MAG TPA: ArsA family ATPase [Myxococcaceae bacterium]|nr:ArsA family ATPase [Myxococcaceae bacterium]
MSGLLDRRLLLVTGKGGVGKSTVAASLALRLASAGLRTLLCEVNADRRLSRMLGHPEVGPDVTPVEKGLSMVDLEPDAAMREYVLSKIRLERVYRAVFENRMVRYFLRFVPALAETVMLGKVLWHVRQWPDAPGGFDRVVLDLPATGHALTLLGVPQSLVSALPSGPMSSEADWMLDLLTDPVVTSAVLVSLPEELPVNETLELTEALRSRLRIRVGAVVLNQSVESRFGPADLSALAGRPGLSALVQTYEEDARRSQEATERLRAIDAPLVRLPRLVGAEIRREELVSLGDALAEGFR